MGDYNFLTIHVHVQCHKMKLNKSNELEHSPLAVEHHAIFVTHKINVQSVSLSL